MIAKQLKLSKVGNPFYIFPQGDVKQMFAMNSSCKIIWDYLQENTTLDDLIIKVADYYQVEPDIISLDIKEVIQSFINNDLLILDNANNL